MAAKYAIIEAMDKYEKIAQELGVSLKQIDTVLSLTAEGSTIPFIARYRKDMTGNLDEVAIKAIIDRDKSLTALTERKETVLAKIEEQGKLTEALKQAIEAAEKLADVEELYLPYKEKRRTKATIAREAGLFPLARLILQNSPDLEAEAQKFTCEAFPTETAALAGAVDILVEAISEDTQLRALTYQEIHGHSLMTSTLKDESLEHLKSTMIFLRRLRICKATGPWRSIVEKNWAFSKSDSSTNWIGSFVSLRLVLKPKMPMWMRLFNKRLRKKSFLRLNVGFGQS